jgi:hypothetical protein
MGYTSKENLMEKVEAANVFTKQEVDYINKSIETHKELGDDVVLKIGTIDEMERMGILSRFYNLCKEHCFFPKWIENVESGIDHV